MKSLIKSLLLLLMISCSVEEEPDRPLVFFVIGDWGRMGIPDQMVVANQMNEWALQEDPDFIITTGDNFYDEGVVDLNDPHWTNSYESVYDGLAIKDKPWYVVLGNHDYVKNPEVEVSYSLVNPDWNLPSRYHQLQLNMKYFGRVQFVFLDTSPFEQSYYSSSFASNLIQQDTMMQKKWLDSLTSLPNIDWKIVVGHHHIYTGGLRKNDPNSVRKSLEPVFEKNHVDVYFCGHEHDLQHLKEAGKPTNYFVSGTGSAIRDTGMIPQSLFSISALGFMSVSLRKNIMVIKVINYKGEVLYQYELMK